MESSVRKRGPSEDGSLECEAKRCKTEDDEETFIVAMREFSIEDVDFSDLNDDGLVNSLRCGICTDVTIHPHMISECQHTFCKECIEIHCKDATKNHTCPSCRSTIRLHLLRSALSFSNFCNFPEEHSPQDQRFSTGFRQA